MEDPMKRLALALALVGAMLLPGTAFAFHHVGLPATDCAAAAAGSPSNDNGQAKEAILANTPLSLPLPPVGTPGQGSGEGGEFCANGG
jgi:hypothetical protein